GLTAMFLGPLETGLIVTVGIASALYLVMAMSIGYLIMVLTRRTAAAIAAATILMLVLPLLSSIDALAPWAPTTLLATPWSALADIAAPPLSAAAVSSAYASSAASVPNRQSLRRDAYVALMAEAMLGSSKEVPLARSPPRPTRSRTSLELQQVMSRILCNL